MDLKTFTQKRRTVKKIILIFCFLLIFSSLAFTAYIYISPFCTEKEKEFASFIDEGYLAYQHKKYEISLEKYQKALTIYEDDSTLYYYTALTYEKKKEYEKAIETAKEGLKFLNKKSRFYKVHNFKFNLRNDIKLYTLLGDCNRKLERYKEAKEAYSYVIKNVKYKYSDAKFYRGICEYYLREKEEALNDFEAYKAMLERFFTDEAERTFKLETYSQDDLNRACEWIEATINL